MADGLMNPLINEIKDILEIARNNVARKINNELIASYWKIGEIIVRYEQNDNIRAEYALGGLSNNIFASKYTYYIPNKEQLLDEIEKIVRKY